MATYIRLTDYKSSDEKEKEFFNTENRHKAKQKDFSKIPGATIAYWVSNQVGKIFEYSERLEKIAEPKNGMSTTNNEMFLRIWSEVEWKSIGFNITNKTDSIQSKRKWFPYNKGGGYRKWYGNGEYLVNYFNDGAELKKFVVNNPRDPKTTHWSRRLFNTEFFYKKSISFSSIASGDLSLRYYPNGFIFDAAGTSIFISDDDYKYVLSFLNTSFVNYFLHILNPTINILVSDIKSLPILFPNSKEIKQEINDLTQQNIDISKEEWDSRETSWDFTKNQLIKHKSNSKIETAYSNYCNYWKEKFNTLHQNEEELNRLFIDIYELQDELTPVVELKDITILKNEAKIVDQSIVFQADEIMKQFISYGVGVMFGRYSLDKEGLQIANLGDETLVSQMTDETKVSFPIDDDNVIPVLEDDYFKDDIASRFVQFVKTTFGEEDLSENIRFIENSLGTTLRKYFVKGFYEDHIKRYKKRPIYWMVASPKKGFMSLIYMHRYTPDVFAIVQNEYLREYITKLESSKSTNHHIADDESNSATQRKQADKNIVNINKKLDEIIKFDREILTVYAQDKIDIDLDDGVKVNYCKFKDILFPISGLCK
jgi:hypothetical protein